MSAATPQLDRIGAVLLNPAAPLKARFRALFTLRGLGGPEALKYMEKAFADESALLKHEVAYCMGQMGDVAAVPILTGVLQDQTREAIVRHEAGEALAAIGGGDELLATLKEFENDAMPEVADTCRLAVAKMEYYKSKESVDEKEKLSDNPYKSVDPAPPHTETNVGKLREILLDENKSLFERYRAMFSLRNMGTKEANLAIAEGLICKNTLFRHEIAYVLGQVQSPDTKDQLFACLRDTAENDMVRHECAEALGSIAADDINAELEKYLGKEEPAVLRESCVVALDFVEYNNSGEFQYANAVKE